MKNKLIIVSIFLSCCICIKAEEYFDDGVVGSRIFIPSSVAVIKKDNYSLNKLMLAYNGHEIFMNSQKSQSNISYSWPTINKMYNASYLGELVKNVPIDIKGIDARQRTYERDDTVAQVSIIRGKGYVVLFCEFGLKGTDFIVPDIISKSTFKTDSFFSLNLTYKKWQIKSKEYKWAFIIMLIMSFIVPFIIFHYKREYLVFSIFVAIFDFGIGTCSLIIFDNFYWVILLSFVLLFLLIYVFLSDDRKSLYEHIKILYNSVQNFI